MKEQKTLQEAASELRAAGRSLWLAGVGTVAALGEAGGRLFDELVEKGERVERGGLRQSFERAGAKAKRVVGLPTRDDVEKLAARIEKLTQKIDRLAEQA